MVSLNASGPWALQDPSWESWLSIMFPVSSVHSLLSPPDSLLNVWEKLHDDKGTFSFQSLPWPHRQGSGCAYMRLPTSHLLSLGLWDPWERDLSGAWSLGPHVRHRCLQKSSESKKKAFNAWELKGFPKPCFIIIEKIGVFTQGYGKCEFDFCPESRR